MDDIYTSGVLFSLERGCTVQSLRRSTCCIPGKYYVSGMSGAQYLPCIGYLRALIHMTVDNKPICKIYPTASTRDP